MQSEITIIMYHYVRELHHTRYPNIKALLLSEFKEQLEYLKNNYTFITIEDCLNALKSKSSLPQNACLLTFDDGYIDHFTNVFPILLDNGIQGCFFPPAKVALFNKVLDVNKLHFILAETNNKIYDLLNDIKLYLEKNRKKFQLKNYKYYYSKLAIKDRFDPAEVIFIKRLLQAELPENLRWLITNELFNKYVTTDEESFSNELYMDLNQIKCMSSNGMYIGSHGYDHYWVDKLTPNYQKKEIIESLSFLNSVNAPTNNWVMCYPYGAYNLSFIRLLKRYNCALGLTTKVGIANLTDQNAFTLERFDTNDFPKTRIK